MRKINKILILLIIGILLWIPLIQYFTSYWEVDKLHGYFKDEKKPAFTFNSWFNSSFQTRFDKFYNQKFGFRNNFVRLHNQLDYTLFNELHANSVIVGKEDYLYEKNYIKSYLGDDYIGADKISSTIKTIDSIYQVLKENNTEMLIVIAPGKGFFYPEFIPDEMLHERGPTNYDTYVKELKKTEIPFIDFNDLFLKMKDTSSIVLYPKTGIHWSQASIPLVLDSIIKKSESILKMDMPNVHYSFKPLTPEADKQDADIERGLNLFFPLDIPMMSYPIVDFDRDPALTKPKLISIADSFFWQFLNKGYTKHVFSDMQFWYYYKQIYGTDQKDLFVKDIHVRKELFNSDLVILMATDANLYKFPYGFTTALETTEFDEAEKEEKIQNLINYIRTDKKWLNDISKKAEQKGISLDSMLYLDAKYVIDKQN